LIAPGLDKIGVMLPYSPLLELIATSTNKPLVATSANISGSPIIYEDNVAKDELLNVADRLLTFERDIVIPQDDSVLQFTEEGSRIILRRSRGMAPNFFPNPLPFSNEQILAVGAELKGAFAIRQKDNLFISQYMGDQGSLESQKSFSATLNHLSSMLHFHPETILVDKHPGYQSAAKGRQLAAEKAITVHEYQHHKAHFAAVLAENRLLDSSERIMGVVWDGTGYGDDGQIWGGEFFLFESGRMERKSHLDYFPQLAGDKMSREPRLSALSLMRGKSGLMDRIRNTFSDTEWAYFQKLCTQEDIVMTSSMGRLLDAMACLIDGHTHNRYEGEAAMRLEALARSTTVLPTDSYRMPVVFDRVDGSHLAQQIIEDLDLGKDKAWIAYKLFLSLAVLIDQVSDLYHINQIAFSGGVFQNALLTDMINRQMAMRKKLIFHQHLSPNDESIALGQLALYQLSGADLQNSSNTSHVFSHTR
jgi:hydrogenase maturation protein HypF